MQEITKKNARIWSMLGMRRTVGVVLKELAETDERFMFATADMARYLGTEGFQEMFPEQMIDVGIAEQNLIGVAAAMQKEGLHVFASTYATFLTARALDQIRVNMGYMNLGVKLIGISGGMSDGNFSPTHMALEDIADMRVIPNMTVICPADASELVKALYALAEYDGPAYLRLTGRTNLPMIYTQEYEFQIGKAIDLRQGTDVMLIAAGTMVATALKVAEILESQGLGCQVVDMHTIKPLDVEVLDRAVNYKLMVTMEEHMMAGGLGSAVAEYMSDKVNRPVHQIIGINDFFPQAGEYEDLLKQCELTAEQIATKVSKKYQEIINA